MYVHCTLWQWVRFLYLEIYLFDYTRVTSGENHMNLARMISNAVNKDQGPAIWCQVRPKYLIKQLKRLFPDHQNLLNIIKQAQNLGTVQKRIEIPMNDVLTQYFRVYNQADMLYDVQKNFSKTAKPFCKNARNLLEKGRIKFTILFH